jgi:hypothetical protein
LNQFDKLGQSPEWSEDDKKAFEKIDYLIHKLFAQTEEGRELIEIWAESILMTPSAVSTDTLLDIGLAEGQKAFIRGLILTVQKVEQG